MIFIFKQLQNFDCSIMSNSFLGTPSNLEGYQIAAAIIAALYTGIFVMLNNQYVFRPKVEHFIAQSSLHSKALNQFIIDFVSNLPHFAFLICTILISSSDSCLNVLIFSDLGWSGLFVGLLAFRRTTEKETGNWKLMLCKNIILLVIAYLTISIHYISQNYLVSLGIILFLLYFINLAIDANEEKFIAIIQFLFGYRPESENEELTPAGSRLVSLEYLARHFPISNGEIKEKMHSYEKELKGIKIKTKSLVAQKLMKVALAVHLSKQKMEVKAKRDIKNYYGTFNGTVADRSRRIIVEKHTCDEMVDDQQITVIETAEEIDTCLFYLFPVKIFESSKILSIIFSITLNITYGFLLSFTLYSTDHLENGKYAHLFYGLLLLPALPVASKADYFVSMSLSSLWKYCLFGLLLAFYCLANGSANFNLGINTALKFTPIILAFSISLSGFMIIKSESAKYRFLFVWSGATILALLFLFRAS